MFAKLARGVGFNGERVNQAMHGHPVARVWIILFMVVVSMPREDARAQLSENLSNAERLLLFRMGTGRISNRTFQRYVIAADLVNRSDNFLSQDSVRQRNARLRAQRNQRALEQLMQSGDSPPASVGPPPSAASLLAQSNVTLVWDTFGVSFFTADPARVRSLAPKFRGGLEVAAVQVDGPADKAGWVAGDILLGLYKYQTISYSDLAYVASLPDLATLGPLRALLLRRENVVESLIQPSTGTTKPPAATSADSNETKDEEPREEMLAWEDVGARVEVTPVDGQPHFRSGLKILEIRDESPAKAADWRTGDILVGLAEFKIANLWDLAFVATDAQRDPNQRTPYLILREGKLERGEIQLPIAR